MDLVSLSEQLLLRVKMRATVGDETGRIQSISLDQLQSELQTDAQKLAFWINLYNAFYLVLRLEKKTPLPVIFTGKAIAVAGLRLSLDDIEHGILRRNRIKWSLGYLVNPFAPGILKRLAVSRLDYRIHFALNCGARSCPPIAFYTAEEIDRQLETAMLSFIESETEVLREQKEVRISRIFLWYLGDFGGCRGIQRLLQEKSGLDTSGLRLRPAPYDWTERLDNFVEIGD